MDFNLGGVVRAGERGSAGTQQHAVSSCGAGF
jgi:hypothetical protein